MTKNNIILSALVIGLSLSSCSKLIKDNQNTDPTVLTVADPTVLLPTAEAALMYYHGGDAARMSSLFTQQIVGGANQYASFATYQFSDADFQNQWQSYYATVLNNLNKINQYSKSKNFKFYEGISEILSAYTFAELVDLYGDVPYSEALKGAANLTPKFDKGADIYNSLFTRLDAAVILLSGDAAKAGLIPGTDDLVYGGDVAKWIMFANALKARMYLHLSKNDPSAISKGLTAINSGFITSADEAVVAVPAPSTSPAYQFQGARNGDILYIGSELYNQMNVDGDGRMDALLDTTNDAMGPFYGSASSAVPLLSYTEQLFIQAELEARSNVATAGATFADAIKASFNQVGATGAPAIVAAYPYNAAETNLALRIKPIMQQKYIAMFNTPEALNDWRRTGIPSLTPAIGTKIPRRFLYPINEKNSNPNVPKGITVYDPVFWDN
jgi:Starch-binding associating with outer membrane